MLISSINQDETKSSEENDKCRVLNRVVLAFFYFFFQSMVKTIFIKSQKILTR